MNKTVLDVSRLNISFEDYNRLLEECIINKNELDSAAINMIDNNIDLDKLKFNVKFI